MYVDGNEVPHPSGTHNWERALDILVVNEVGASGVAALKENDVASMVYRDGAKLKVGISAPMKAAIAALNSFPKISLLS